MGAVTRCRTLSPRKVTLPLLATADRTKAAVLNRAPVLHVMLRTSRAGFRFHCTLINHLIIRTWKPPLVAQPHEWNLGVEHCGHSHNHKEPTQPISSALIQLDFVVAGQLVDICD